MKFDHIHAKYRDIEKAVEYYQKIFGAKIILREAIRGNPLIRLNLGGTMFNISAVGKDENLTDPTPREKLWPKIGIGHLGMLVDDLDKTVREIKAKGAEFFTQPQEASPGTRFAFVKGPEEDVIEILQRDKPITY